MWNMWGAKPSPHCPRSWMCGGEKVGMDRAQDEAAPSSQPSAFPPVTLTCCWARVLFWLCTIWVCKDEEWGRKTLLWHNNHLQDWAHAKPTLTHASLLKGCFRKKITWVSWKLPRYVFTSLFSLTLDLWFSISAIHCLRKDHLERLDGMKITLSLMSSSWELGL